jgi:uncharacterized protein involved in copper resistance
MPSRGFYLLVLGLGPIALTACVETEAATAQPTSAVPAIGVDLGNSAHVPQIAGLAGEGEGYGRTEPGTTPTAHSSRPGMDRGSASGMQMDHGTMPGMNHGSTSGVRMDHGSIPGMGHETGTQMDHDSMPGMSHGSTSGTQMDHGSMSGMSHGSTSGTQMDHGSMSGMSHGSTSGMQMTHGSRPRVRHALGRSMQMAHSGHTHAKGAGTVNSIDAAAHKVNISHGPISTIGLPAMTMDFAVAPRSICKP